MQIIINFYQYNCTLFLLFYIFNYEIMIPYPHATITSLQLWFIATPIITVAINLMQTLRRKMLNYNEYNTKLRNAAKIVSMSTSRGGSLQL